MSGDAGRIRGGGDHCDSRPGSGPDGNHGSRDGWNRFSGRVDYDRDGSFQLSDPAGYRLHRDPGVSRDGWVRISDPAGYRLRRDPGVSRDGWFRISDPAGYRLHRDPGVSLGWWILILVRAGYARRRGPAARRDDMFQCGGCVDYYHYYRGGNRSGGCLCHVCRCPEPARAEYEDRSGPSPGRRGRARDRHDCCAEPCDPSGDPGPGHRVVNCGRSGLRAGGPRRDYYPAGLTSWPAGRRGFARAAQTIAMSSSADRPVDCRDCDFLNASVAGFVLPTKQIGPTHCVHGDFALRRHP